MSESERPYYGWRDIADLVEAIVFYAEMFSRGHTHAEISRMLDHYFPKIDLITLKLIRRRAFVWMRGKVTNIEKKIYLAKSIIRLERICANPGEKTKNVLAADSQLTFLLGLVGVEEKDGPEELAAKMREFNKASQEASDGTTWESNEKSEDAPKEAKQEKTPPDSEVLPLDELTLTAEEKTMNDNLRKARASRIKTAIKKEEERLNRKRQRVNEEGHQYGNSVSERSCEDDAGSGKKSVRPEMQKDSGVAKNYSESAADAYQDAQKTDGITEPLYDVDPDIQDYVDGLDE
jgi:hypothetical protein